MALSRSGLLDVPETSNLGERVREYILGNELDFQAIVASLDNVEAAVAQAAVRGTIFPVVVATVAVLLTAAVVAILAVVSATVVVVNLDVYGQSTAPQSNSKILSLDPDEYEKMQNAVRVANLVGGKDLVRSAYDYIVDEESNAMTDALVEVYFSPRGRDDEVTVQTLRSSVKTALTRLYGLS